MFVVSFLMRLRDRGLWQVTSHMWVPCIITGPWIQGRIISAM